MSSRAPSLASVAALAVLVSFSATASASWTEETVAPFGPEASMALTADGRPVVVYSSGQTVVVATRGATGGWTLEPLAIPMLAAPKSQVDGGSPSQTQLLYVSRPSVAVDRITADPRVAWIRNWDADVWYAQRTSGAWSYQLLSGSGGSPSLVIDRDGVSRVAFGGVYGVRAAGSWTFEPVGTGWSEASLMLDAQDGPSIAFARGNGPGPQLSFATLTGSGWSSEPVETTGHEIWETSAALDGANQPHVVFVDDSDQLVRYAHREGTSWTVETVAGPVGAGSGVALALGAGGEPFIAYLDNGSERFARRVAGTWTSEAVSAPGLGGHSSQLAIDAAGRPHLVYVEYNTNRVRYAVRADAVTGVEPAVAALGFGIASLGPNPAKSGGAIDLALRLDAPRRLTIELLDLAGRRVAVREPVTLAAGTPHVSWSPRVASAGLYFLAVRSERGEQVTTRVALLP